MPAIEPRYVAQVPWPATTLDLSPVVVEQLAWQIDALCAEVGGDGWFPEKGESVRLPKQICMACPVRSECLEYALKNHESFGVWGGKSERERRRIRKERAAEGKAEVAA